MKQEKKLPEYFKYNEYVELWTEFVTAESKEEEAARLKKEEEERKKAAAAAEAARKKKEVEKKKKDESIRLDNLYTHAIELRKEYLLALREYESAVTNFVELYGSEHDKSLCSIINEIFS